MTLLSDQSEPVGLGGSSSWPVGSDWQLEQYESASPRQSMQIVMIFYAYVKASCLFFQQTVQMHAAAWRRGYPADSSDLAVGPADVTLSPPSFLRHRLDRCSCSRPARFLLLTRKVYAFTCRVSAYAVPLPGE